jgi:hypothetical protein
VTEVVDGRFVIEREAGAGGMARVYRARDATTGDIVALKILNNAEEQDLRRFAREVHALAELHHPSIVRYIAHGRTATGLAYLAMEWLDGEGLDARLVRGALPLADALAIGRGIAGALAIAHARGLVHRDVKPANVLLAGGDPARVKLLDFGLARDAIAAMALTTTGELLGTPLYMSPEQARGERDLDARADVYSLGATLYVMLAGQPPLVAPNLVGLLAKIIVEDPQPVGELRGGLPAKLSRLVSGMLAKSRDARPADGAAALAELAAIEVDAPSEGSPERPSAPTLRRQRVVSILMASGVAAAATLDATVALSTLDPRRGGALALADGSRLVVFSGPESPADLAARAAHYALGVRAAGAAVAVATGRASLTGTMPVGEVIDRAARLLARALGTIRCDADTAGLIESRFELDRDDDGAELLAECGRDGQPSDTLLGKPSRCVGRDRELTALEGYYSECIAESVARVVVVIAEAGVGKSRLGRELAQRLDRRDDPPARWLIRGEPATAASSFAGAVSAIRRAAGIEVGDAPGARATKLAALLARTGSTSPATAEFIAELLGHARGTPSPRIAAARDAPALMFDGIRDAWVSWLSDACARQPQVIVVEDLHWVDGPTIALLDAALAALAERPLLVLALARPDVRDRTPAPFVARKPHELRLDPLPRRASERLVRDALGAAASDDKVAAIVGRAAGNALFLEELVRSAASTHGASTPVGVIGTLQLRFDTLSTGARQFAHAASVIGERFGHDAVAALLPGDADLPGAVAELVAGELIVGDGAASYRFRHALVRDAAYELIADVDRAAAHALAGDHFARREGADPVVVAHHYELARRAADAARWYRRAAEHALAHHDLGDAISHARRARDWLPADDAASAAVLDQIVAEAELWRGNLVQAREAAERALACLSSDTPEWLAAASLMIATAGQIGDNATIAAWLGRVEHVEPPPSGAAPLIRSLARASGQLAWTDYGKASGDALARAERLAAAQPLDPLTATRLETARAYAAFRAASFGACFAALERARRCSEQVGAMRDAMQAELILSGMRQFAGQIDRARAELEAAIPRAAELHLDYMVHWGRFQLAVIANIRGDRAVAQSLIVQVPEVVRSTPLLGAGFALTRAWAALGDGDLEDVDRLIVVMRGPGVASRFHASADAFDACIHGLRGGERRAVARGATAALALLAAEPMRAELHMIGFSVALRALRDAGDPGAGAAFAAHRARLTAVRDANPETGLGDAYLTLPWNRAVLAG